MWYGNDWKPVASCLLLLSEAKAFLCCNRSLDVVEEKKCTIFGEEDCEVYTSTWTYLRIFTVRPSCQSWKFPKLKQTCGLVEAEDHFTDGAMNLQREAFTDIQMDRMAFGLSPPHTPRIVACLSSSAFPPTELFKIVRRCEMTTQLVSSQF